MIVGHLKWPNTTKGSSSETPETIQTKSSQQQYDTWEKNEPFQQVAVKQLKQIGVTQVTGNIVL